MNRMTQLTRLTWLMMVMILGTAMVVHAEDRKTIQGRIDKRLAALEKYRDAGKAGETYQAQVELVKPEYANDSTLTGLIKEENDDRKALFAAIASETGGSVDDVAKTYAKRLFEIAKPDHYLKGKNGVWIQKKSRG